jgi:hypothetical protein
MTKELEEIEKLKAEILALKGLTQEYNKNEKRVYRFSDMTFSKLKECVSIEREFDISNTFNNWFDFEYKLTDEENIFLEKLIDKYSIYLDGYKEETLKAHFVIPILNKIDFLIPEYKCSGLYEEKIVYEAEDFIFNGTTDFVISKGLVEAEKPYFFIQEFKQEKGTSDPEYQLVAELISAVELNNWTIMKGAYIKGINWKFVILEKLGKHKYQYFVSKSFDSTDIEKLKSIYKNLVCIKHEVIEMIKRGE